MIEQLSAELGLDVHWAPESLDACVALCRSDRRQLLLCLGNDPVREATLSAACKRTKTTVIFGSLVDMQEYAAEIAREVGPGRLIRTWEWALEPEIVRYARSGAVDASDAEPARILAESPLAPSALVRKAMLDAVGALRPEHYPPLHPSALIDALAAHHGVDASRVAVSGAGSVELLQRVLRAFVDPGDEVQAFAPTFDQLPSLCAQAGLVLRLSRDETVSPGARLVYVVTPNGPDLRKKTRQELEGIRAALPPDRLLVVDRAYASIDEADELQLDAEGPLLILRSFSKSGALAGMRIGWAVGPEPVIRVLRRFGAPYGVSEIASRAALAALSDKPHRESSTRELARAREAFIQKLEELGFSVLDSHEHLVCVKADAHLRQLIELDESLPFQPVPGRFGVFLVVVEPVSVLSARFQPR